MTQRPIGHKVFCKLFLCTAVVLGGCGDAKQLPDPEGTGQPVSFAPKVLEFLGEDLSDILRDPDRIESFRLDPKSGHSGRKPALGTYAIIATGPELTAAQRESLIALIGSDSSYRFDVAKGCKFMPGAGFRFVKGNQSVAVLLCFSCNEWSFASEDQSARVEDFDPVRTDLVRLVKQLFPNDKVIQGLDPSK